MAHYKISNRGSQILIFLSVGIWLESIDAMASEQDVQDLQQKNRPTKLKIQQYI